MKVNRFPFTQSAEPAIGPDHWGVGKSLDIMGVVQYPDQKFASIRYRNNIVIFKGIGQKGRPAEKQKK